MKKRLLALLDAFLWANPWFIGLFLDYDPIRKRFLNAYFQNRPAWFERYYAWKPAWFCQKKILIIKTDAIGDYLLFRNLFQDIAQHFKPKGYQIHLLGNQVWKELAEALDGTHIDRFFWLEKGRFNAPLAESYRITVLQQMAENTYETLLYPNISRETLAGDWLVRHCTSAHKIGYRGDVQNQTREQHLAGNPAYTRLVEPDPSVLFEYERNRQIVARLLNREPDTLYPAISQPARLSKAEKYAVLFPGASTPLKQWPWQHFVETAQWISATYGFKIRVAGGAEDVAIAGQMVSQLPHAENIAGKTSLLELVRCISNASLLLTNDTSAVHMGAQSGVPTVCLFKGNHFGRFLPYPTKEFPRVQVCLPTRLLGFTVEELKANYSQTYGEAIEEVEVEAVKKAIGQVLDAQTPRPLYST